MAKLREISLLIRGKKNMETIKFEDLGNGLVRDKDGNRFMMVVNRPDGGYLRGDGNIMFRFPVA